LSAIDQLFADLRANDRKALMPFITAGDPNIETTEAIIRSLSLAGADMCEVGVPYSDPIADGPVIQASYQRALDRKFKLQEVFEMGDRLSSGNAEASSDSMPLVTMISYAIIYRVGLEKYVTMAKQSGYAGAIVPDLLVEEADELSSICKRQDFSLVQLVTPTTTRERQVRIAELSSGFLYYVSVTGITGERRELPPDLVDNVGWLREQTELPICIGFGISGPDTAAQLAPVADGLIVGSAVVRRVAETKGGESAATAVQSFVRELRGAIDQASA
jgi:tryptophan synthase alpha chain